MLILGLGVGAETRRRTQARLTFLLKYNSKVPDSQQ